MLIHGMKRPPMGPLVAPFLALLSARFPGLLTLPAVSPRPPQVSGAPAGRMLRARHLKRAALWRAVAAVAVTGIMVAAAFAGMPGVVHQAAARPHVSANLPVNDSTPFFPYLVSDPSFYPAPEEILLPGNASYPQMVTTVNGGLPTLHLLTVVNENGTFHPVLLSGSYSEDLAREIQDGNGCPSPSKHGNTFCAPPSLALSWSQPLTLSVGVAPASLSAPPAGTALLINGQTWAVAVSTQANQTALWVSTNGGVEWTSYPAQSGGGPHLLTLNDTLTLVTSSPTGIHFTSLLPDGSVDSGSFTEDILSASPVLLPSLPPDPLPTLGIIGVSPRGSVDFDRLSLSGTLFRNTTIGAAPLNRTSPIFRQIGNTALSPPGGVPGQVTALSAGNTTFALWTASVENRVVALTAVSGNAGENWSGPYVSVASLGSLANPTAILTPAGYVLVVWRSSTGGIDLEPYGLDGRSFSPAIPVSPPGTATLSSPPVLAVDSLERPFFAWTGANDTLQVTGALLHAPQAVGAMLQAVQALQPADFANGTNGSQTPLEQKLEALLSMVSTPGSSAGAIQKLEQDIYPKVTSLPLLLGCSGANPVCGHVHEGRNPSWILNETGPLAPNTYLSVYAEWVLESLGVTTLTPPPGDVVEICSPPTAGGGEVTVTCPVNWVTSNGTASGTSGTTLNPLLDDPTTAELDLNDSVPTLTLQGSDTITCNPFHNKTTVHETVNFTFTASATWTYYQVSTAARSASIPQGGNSAVFYLRNLPAGVPTYFNVTEVPHYVSSAHNSSSGGRCSINITAPPPPSVSIQIPGLVEPVENFTPGPHLVLEAPCSVCTDNYTLSLNGTATMPSEAFANATPTAGGSALGWSDTSYLRDINVTATGFSAVAYSMSGNIQSKPGNTTVVVNATATPEIFVQKGPTGTAPLRAAFGCNFTVVPSNLGVSSLVVSDITETTATVTWDTTVAATSEVAISEVGVGGTRFPSVPGNTTHHVVPLSGLDPFALYHLQVITGVPNTGCLGVEIETPVTEFNTTATFALGEFDLAYDSITQEGGGAVLIWDVPSFVLSRSYSTFTSGVIEYAPVGNPANVTDVPILNLTGGALLQFGSGDLTAFDTTLSLLTPNTDYSVRAILNFTVGGPCTLCNLTGQSQPFTFDYLKDTSGDGLSDAEKTYGWFVTDMDTSGARHESQVIANPQDYATNGLVSDYVEKEFGLNPETIDTAGSHMLDTWNLTFNVNGHVPVSNFNLQCPSAFECWNSGGGNLAPFDASPAPGVAPPGKPLALNLSNLSDDSFWASQVLWSYSSFLALQNLTVAEHIGWLRGVFGTYGMLQTFTVWGKLSWGADPLTASTPGDGVPDGARVNPLFEEQLQIQLPDVTLFDSSLANGDGVAVCFNVNATNNLASLAASNWNPEFQGCASESEVNSGSASIFSYFLTSPVAQTYQWQNVTVRLLVNTATCTPESVGGNNTCTGGQTGYNISTLPLYCDSFGNKYYQFPAFFDMMNASSFGGVNLTNCGNSHYNDYVGLDVTDVPVEKAPTYLWVPDDNSTLSDLPAGLQRYTGEQSFFQVVANVLPSGPFNLSVPTPWHSTYSVGVPYAPSLLNLLIPRGQFLASPLGEQVLLNRTIPFSGIGNLPVWGQSMNSLECYWAQSADGGCSQAAAQSLSVYSPESTTNGAVPLNCTQSPNAPNCVAAGVVANPALEAGYASPSVAGVLTFNITSATDFRALLAGLLVNTTGGVNGTFQDVTNKLSSLGLDVAVMSALATMTPEFNNSGVFGLPVSYAIPVPPPPPASCGGLGCLFNSLAGVTSFLGQVVTGLVGIVGAVWTAVVQARAFFDFVAQGLKVFAENPVGATVGALAVVGAALEAALLALLTVLYDVAKDFFSDIVKPLLSGAEAYIASITTATLGLLSTLANVTTSSSSFSEVALSLADFGLSLVGLSSFARPLTNLMSEVMSTLQPVLSLLNPAYLVSLLGDAIGAATGSNPIATIMGAISSLVNGLYSAIFGAVAGFLGALGLASKTVPTGTTNFPSTSDASTFVNDSASTSGNSSLPGLFSGILTDPAGPLQVLTVARIVMFLDIMILILVSGSTSSLAFYFEPFIPFATQLDLVDSLPGGVLVMQGIGLFLSLMSFFISNTLVKLFLGIWGATLGTIVTISNLVGLPTLFKSQAPIKSLLPVLLINTGLGWVSPIVTAHSL